MLHDIKEYMSNANTIVSYICGILIINGIVLMIIDNDYSETVLALFKLFFIYQTHFTFSRIPCERGYMSNFHIWKLRQILNKF